MMGGAVDRLSEDLQAKLREALETLDAIRNGDVDAIVVGGENGQQVYTLLNADRPYRILIEQMMEGAVTLSEEGIILYCNDRFAQFAQAKKRPSWDPTSRVTSPVLFISSPPARRES